MNYYDEQDDIKAFADFSGLYKFLKVLAAVILTVLVLIFKI